MLTLPITQHYMILNWIAVGFYIVSTFFFTLELTFQKEWAIKPAMASALVGLAPHSVSILGRWWEASHGPYMAKYEILTSIAWLTVLLCLITVWKIKRLRAIGVFVMPLCFLMMVFALFTNPGIHRLPPSLRSVWLVVHIIFNKIAAGSMIIALGTSILHLIKEKRPDRPMAARLPAAEILDAYTYKFVSFGFVFWSVTIGAGAIWANEAWGRYWGWDPIETWSAITWLLFGLYLHLRYFFRWSGNKAAWMMIVCFTSSIFTLFILPFLSGSIHSEYFK